jgi:hypothetical protein
MRLVKPAVAAAIVGLALGLSACETATPYQPLKTSGSGSGGYTEQRLDVNHFRVTFHGNTSTSRETVETYLLYRAAELTLAHGYDWFETSDRRTSRDARTYVTSDPFYGPGYAYGYWRPSYRYYGAYGWRGWGPYDPTWGGSATVSTVQKFEASAEIVMRRGPKPESDPRGLDARSVIANLGPKIQRPAP